MIVLDSSFLVADHNRRDVHHSAAAAAMEKLVAANGALPFSPSTSFSRWSPCFSPVGGSMSPCGLQRLPSSDMFPDVMETFRGQRRGRLSFADDAIVTVALKRAARFVATFDRDFRQVEGVGAVPA